MKNRQPARTGWPSILGGLVMAAVFSGVALSEGLSKSSLIPLAIFTAASTIWLSRLLQSCFAPQGSPWHEQQHEADAIDAGGTGTLRLTQDPTMPQAPLRIDLSKRRDDWKESVGFLQTDIGRPKVLHVFLVNESSQPVRDTSLWIESIEDNPGNPATARQTPCNVKLFFGDGATEKTLSPGVREKIALCSVRIGSEDITLDATGDTFPFCGTAHKFRLIATGRGYRPLTQDLHITINAGGGLDAAPAPAS